VKEFLSRAEVPFVVRDVDEDDGAYDELVSLGWRAVPVTMIGDRAIKGFDPVALREALQVLTTRKEEL
jgi:glutaredoxin-like protein NrdH